MGWGILMQDLKQGFGEPHLQILSQHSCWEWVYWPGEGGLGGAPTVSETALEVNHSIEPREGRKEAQRSQ